MDYITYLARIIDDGIAAVERDYARDPVKLKGAKEGFEACRGKSPPELQKLLGEARHRTAEAYRQVESAYWEIACFEAEVEWTCNCVSAALANEGQPTIVTPTARAVLKVAEVLGVASW